MLEVKNIIYLTKLFIYQGSVYVKYMLISARKANLCCPFNQYNKGISC